MLVEFEVNDNFVTDLEAEVALEETQLSAVERLTKISQDIAQNGISRTMADTITNISTEALGDINLNSFTRVRTNVNAVASVESIGKGIVNLLVALTKKLWDFLLKCIEWLIEKGRAKPEDVRKTVDKLLSIDTYRNQLRTAKETTDPDKAVQLQKIISGEDPEVAEARQLAVSSYTVLVRSSMVSYEDTKRLFSYGTMLGTVDKAFEAATTAFLETIEKINATGNIAEIKALLSIAANLHDTFIDALLPICQKIVRLRLDGIVMPKLHRDSTVEFLADLRHVMIRAAMTPATQSIEADIPDLESQTQRIVQISSLSDELIKEFSKRKSQHAELVKSVKKLREATEKKEYGNNLLVENEEAVRKALLLVNRQLRSMALTIMRLREIPDIYTKAHKQFIGRAGRAAVIEATKLKEL